MDFVQDRTKNGWRKLTDRALWEARRHQASYADIRITLGEKEELSTEGFGSEEALISGTDRDESEYIGIRVLINGTWGFAGAPFNQAASVEHLVRRAADMAKANACLQRRPVELAPIAPADIFHTTPYHIDPFLVSWDQKLALLMSADRAMREVSPLIYKRNTELSLWKIKKILATSDGVLAIQEFMECGAYISAHARRQAGDDAQRRSYPDAHAHFMRGGWEVIEQLNLLNHASEMAHEAEQLLYAPYCPEGERDIILLSTMANLHCGHETIHGFEADRILGTEWTLAGGSFITAILPEIGNFRFGSPHVNIIADSLHPQGVGTFACDDEGAPGQRVYLIKEGILKGLLTSRETVPELNRLLGRDYFTHSGATVRAMDAANFPLIRMVNIIIEPGEMSFEEMKDRAPVGTIMFGTNKSWSIDDIRRHFNFGSEIAHEKVSDNRWELRKNPEYAGDNLIFFRNCQGFADQQSFFMHGIGNCGKDIAPIQSMHTGHGTSPGWFSNVNVRSCGHGGR